MAVYTYQDCLDQCLTHIKTYNTARRNNQWDYWEFQDIRDELSEALVYFGPVYADLRSDAEQAEVNRKMYFDERKLYWKDHFKGERGTASLAESKAMLDCKHHYDEEVESRRKYYKARQLMERIDQTLNGIASRLKPLDKYDSKNQVHDKKVSY